MRHRGGGGQRAERARRAHKQRARKVRPAAIKPRRSIVAEGNGQVTVYSVHSGVLHFRCLPGATAHTTQDGRDINLWDWEGHSVDCGAPFVVSTTFQNYDPAEDPHGSGGGRFVARCHRCGQQRAAS